MTDADRIDRLTNLVAQLVELQVAHNAHQLETLAQMSENVSRLITMMAFLAAAVEQIKLSGTPAANDP